MIEVLKYNQQYKARVFAWSTEAFNEATGNQCKDFKRNRYQAPDF